MNDGAACCVAAVGVRGAETELELDAECECECACECAGVACRDLLCCRHSCCPLASSASPIAPWSPECW